MSEPRYPERYRQPEFENEGIYTRFTPAGTDINQTFNALVEKFDEELVDGAEDSFLVFDKVLNVIDRVGIRIGAEAVIKQVENIGELSKPASPSDVIEYFRRLRTNRFVKIKDIGSVDPQLVAQLQLTDLGYVDQLQQLITWLDPDITEISVLDLPQVAARKREEAIQHTEKAIVLEVIERHGIILPLMDQSDIKAWQDLRHVVQQLADPNLRNVSYRLRERRLQGERVLLEDVIDTIEDIRRIRRQAFTIALDNRNAPAAEVRRLMEGELPPYTKELVAGYLADIAASEGEGADPERVSEILEEDS